MAQPDNAASIKACALRVARLAANGTTPAGASNGYITKNFITLTMSPENDEGTDYSQRNACGDTPFPVKDEPAIKWWNLELELMIPDPELFELLTTGPVILSTPAAASTPTGNITNGSATVTNLSAPVSTLDRGATIAGTGIPAATTILEILSPTSVLMSANATATTAGVSLTLTPIAQAIGAEATTLGSRSVANGVSVEVFSNAYVGSAPAPVLPYFKRAFPRTTWTLSDDGFGDSRQSPKLTGKATENSNWGNGPWNDWVEPSPSTRSLSKAWGWHRTSSLPTPAVGYVAVPTQV